jgi:hypothetical protein
MKSKKRHKTVEIMVFLSIVLLVDKRICIREAQKLTDPDPVHCL